ncbi:hypothetical protein JIN85_13885 [Luteolibacter pohnpeiensis]|uniref:Uncharacterized protein n=1 Tax=Luteolibacter pohnpeiensis TaxID=454153 RepID=A0A934S7Z9_9BACT|nr:hypothetical protein [Luteolibacter pohnpeiensis]MBK1883513.1 hypothetical protein [Luteolibacter pohnpeiensis]
MKFQITLSCLIIAIAAVPGWMNHRHLNSLRDSLFQLQAKAKAAGITIDASGSPITTRSSERKQRTESPDVGQLADELIDFARALQATNRDTDHIANQQAILDWQLKLSHLDTETLKQLLAEIQQTTKPDDPIQGELLSIIYQTIAENDPHAALDVFSENITQVSARDLTTALLGEMKHNRAGGIDWLVNHRDSLSDGTDNNLIDGLLRGALTIDSKLGFELIDQLDLDPSRWLGIVISPARSAEQRTTMLAAFREYAASIDDPDRLSVVNEEGYNALLSNSFIHDGVGDSIQWIEASNLPLEQLEDYAARTFFSCTPKDEMKWIDWIGSNIQADSILTEAIPNRVTILTSRDPAAAGAWIEAMPSGKVKEIATTCYVTAVSGYQPLEAYAWLKKLPADDNRAALLEQIHQNWPADQPWPEN